MAGKGARPHAVGSLKKPVCDLLWFPYFHPAGREECEVTEESVQRECGETLREKENEETRKNRCIVCSLDKTMLRENPGR
jgi:hypothetical protein